MESGDPDASRRLLLKLAASGSLAGLAGCINTPTSGPIMVEEPADYCFDQLEESVPEIEANATSIDGLDRLGQENLVSKTEAGYACGPQDGQMCGNCTFYIDDKNGDAIGACTQVAGEIRSVDWCGIWQPREKLPEDDVPEDDG